ncbi:metallophosphoesterase family protein [Microvirga lotononidis]|uniref:Putative phosphohydrolase n=1 Tax=Microvirga lotononidis TaxID=864069 RepID=I4YKY8_9HYPH|nr:metallophosphoesterase [Microvirga lotononidis]EIM24630.1 putative phosphohydrolase [Microvirga lotononidis]WQO26645.1 metallophosphoesterase [Microvirga lotononidis]
MATKSQLIQATGSTQEPLSSSRRPLLIDPRRGDVEDDLASTKSRSLFAIGGRLLAEISIPKLILAWTMLIGLPAVLLGLAPLVVLGWAATFSGQASTALAGIWPLLILAGLGALAWIGGKPVLRAAERSFWSLNALAVQPVYTLFREGLRHIAGKLVPGRPPHRLTRLYAVAALCGGLLVSALAGCLVLLAWPESRWVGDAWDLLTPFHLIVPALANAAVIVGCYVTGAALVWAVADAALGRPSDLMAFDAMPPDARTWRVAHLSDLHAVGERYGFRIESGRTGPQGNGQMRQVLDRLDAVHAREPLDLVLITGDMTDAGRPGEWAAFMDAVADHPALAERLLILPGNHDVNVVDRANPARLELPTSPGKRLRQLRTLSIMEALHGGRVFCFDTESGRLGTTLSERLAPYRDDIAAFADDGGLRRSMRLTRIWDDVFPMIAPPTTEDGLGVVILNSNAEAHFSFTNALGLISALHAKDLAAAMELYPRAGWIVALHHHLVEYPTPAKAFSERIGTALINGTWFVGQLRPFADRLVVFHGHRHTEWIGQCGGVRIVSASSPVMSPSRTGGVSFFVHELSVGGGTLKLASPERIEVRLPDGSGPEWADPFPPADRAASPATGSPDPGHRR